MRYPYKVGGTTIGYYELNPMPGCNQMLVSNHAWIAPAYRNHGYGDAAHKQRLAQAEELLYNYIICTVKESNTIQKRILERNGWKKLDSFSNKESGNQVEIWGRSL